MNEDVRTCGQGVCPIDVSKSVFHKPIGAVYHLVEGQSLICYAGSLLPSYGHALDRSEHTGLHIRAGFETWMESMSQLGILLYYVVLTEEGWRHWPSQLEL